MAAKGWREHLGVQEIVVVVPHAHAVCDPDQNLYLTQVHFIARTSSKLELIQRQRGNIFFVPWNLCIKPTVKINSSNPHHTIGKQQFHNPPFADCLENCLETPPPVFALCFSFILTPHLSTPTPSDTRHVGVSPTRSNFLWHQLGVLRFNSVPTFHGDRQCQIHPPRAQPYKALPPPPFRHPTLCYLCF